MEKLRLIPNAGTVAKRSSSMWALYGAFVIDISIKALEFIQTHRGIKWQDAIVPIALIIIGSARLTRQPDLETATQQDLATEKLARLAFEKEATAVGPPISTETAEKIKREAAEAAKA